MKDAQIRKEKLLNEEDMQRHLMSQVKMKENIKNKI
jgi:hypothetical protein